MAHKASDKLSIRRTLSLTAKIVAEQPRNFLMRMLIPFGALIIGTILIGLNNQNEYRYMRTLEDPSISGECVFFAFMLFVLGIIYTSLAFNQAKNKIGRTNLLGLPALTAEKFIAHWLMYVPMFLIFYICAMWAADAVRVGVMHMIYTNTEMLHFITVDKFLDSNTSVTLAFFLTAQSFYFLGSAIWPSNSFIKTFAAMTILSNFYSIAAYLLYQLIIGNNAYHLSKTESIDPVHILWICTAVICIINYSLSYLRLKEMDVISHR